MQYLIEQEKFELEVLDRLNSKKLLSYLAFAGGTMLRLCYGLNRFSVGIDFWLIKKVDHGKFFEDLRDYLGLFYTIKDSANKFNTLLFELKSKDYPRSLKIEIRKGNRKIKTGTAIAYSKYSNTQVFLKVFSLEEMMRAKVAAFLDRKEIRDAFDIEFLLKKGITLDVPPPELKSILKIIAGLTKNDYKVKLGSLLSSKERPYYIKENFKILKLAINEKIG